MLCGLCKLWGKGGEGEAHLRKGGMGSLSADNLTKETQFPIVKSLDQQQGCCWTV